MNLNSRLISDYQGLSSDHENETSTIIDNSLKRIDHRKAKVLFSLGDNGAENFFDQDQDSVEYFSSKLGIKKESINNKILSATIYKIKGNDVIVDMNLKNYGKLAKDELRIGLKNLDVKIGDKIPVLAESIDAKHGPYIKASWEKAKRLELWDEFEKFKQEKTIVMGSIQSETRGGYVANIMGVKCFIPGSHIDFRPPEKKVLDELKAQEQQFIVLSMERDENKNNIVVSRREVLNLERMKIKDVAIDKIKIGDVLDGVVKNIAPYGCFINLKVPGMENIAVDGLLHINDISWSKIAHPSECLSLGSEVKIKVINLFPEERKISLGIKQLTDSPWKGLSERLIVGTKTKGVVKNTADYGYFVEIQEGIEGLVHVSEISWSKKANNLNIGQEVDVVILTVDEEKARISLSIKRCFENPWEKFAEKNKINDVISVEIKKIVDFGIFVDLGMDIEGLIHISDLAWNTEDAQKALAKFKVGSQVEAKILSIDTQKGRVALGVKQLEKDYLYEFLTKAQVGQAMECVIVSNWNDKMEVEVAEAKSNVHIEGDNLPTDFAEEKQNKYAKDAKINCKIVSINPEKRELILSTR